MESADSIGQIIALIVLVLASGFFSASETALMSVSKVRIRYLKDSGKPGASVVEKLLNSPKRLLSSILVGNNVVNIAATSISTSVCLKLFGKDGVLVATVFMTIVVLIFGEVTPKTIAANHKEAVALLFGKPLKWITIILKPFVAILNFVTNIIFKLFGITDEDTKSLVTEEDLKIMVNVGHEEGVLQIEEREIINNVFEFGDMQAEDAMIQRIEMVTIEDIDTYEEILEVFKTENLSRLPVFKETVDDIVGILNIKDVIFLSDEQIKNFNVKNYMREPFFTYEFKKITQLLEEMKLAKTQIAIVVDEYGGTSGLITIEDLVEVIVGDIEDEYDVEDEDIKYINEDEYIVDGSAKLNDLNEIMNINIESEEFDTISGYLMGYLNGLPKEKHDIVINNIHFIIENIDKNKINTIRIIKKQKENDFQG